MEDGLRIQLSDASDRALDAFSEFVSEHVSESGRDGALHFAFSRKIVREEIRTNSLARWSRPLEEANWARAWLLWTPDELKVVGHVELKGGRFEAENHRATLGMGLLRAYTGQGWGRRLLETSIAWARRQKQLAWIDLGVFAHNAPARQLYARAGFVEQCRRGDAFRIPGAGEVEDVMMTLSLRDGAGA